MSESVSQADYIKTQFALNHAFLSEPITICDNGVPHTFFPPGNAEGCILDTFKAAYGPRLHAYGAHRFKRGFLWPIEAYVYAQERKAIVSELLAGLNEAKGEWDGAASFVEEISKALQHAYVIDEKSKPMTSAKIKIKVIDGRWWLFHRQWIPLSFDSFEEATAFAKRYILRKDSSRVAT